MTIQVSSIPDAIAPDMLANAANGAGVLSQWLALRAPVNSELDGEIAAYVAGLRDRAAVVVQTQKFPTTRDEEWRFTDLSGLRQIELQAFTVPTLNPTDLEAFVLPEATQSRLVFVNGVYAPNLSNTVGLEGAITGNLHKPGIAEQVTAYLGQQPGSEEIFTALNTASFRDAAVVVIPRNQSIAAPVHLLFLSVATETPTINHPRCLVVAGQGSQVTLLEEYASLGEGSFFTNPVTEIFVETNAEVNHSRIQWDSKAAFHIGKTAVSQARDSRYTCNAISVGAKLSRHHLDVLQTGEQTQTTLNGLTMIGGDQLADTHSAIAYTKPYGSSRQLHKCIVDDQARAVFNGKVFVPKAAQLTDAGQLNRNLLLSPKARVDTKPQLEIVADNVKCSHGATVSQLDAEEVFYLQSRGLDQDSAQKLLIYAFAVEMINQIPVASVRDRLIADLHYQTSLA